MALIIPPGYSHIAFELDLAGDNEPMYTTIGVDNGGVAVDTIPDLLFQAFALEVMPRITLGYTLVRATAYVGQDGAPPLVIDSTLANVVGGLAAEALPQNCAMLVRKRTDASGRRGRGRMYWPGVHEAQVSPTGVLTEGYLADQQLAATGFYNRLTDGVDQAPTPPVVLHRSEGIGVEPLPTPITTLIVDSVIATQRRRLRK